MLLHALCFANLIASAFGASGVASGKSSHILLHEKITAHRDRVRESASLVIDPVKIPAEGISQFFSEYGDYFGVKHDELRVTKEVHESGSRVTNVHHDQYIAGYKVYAGEVVVTLGANNDVLTAHGHALPSIHVDKTMTGNTMVSHDAAMMTVTDRLTSMQPVDSPRRFTCATDRLSVSTEWYRDRIHVGEQGAISLVHHFSGRCADTRSDTSFSQPFDAFVDAHSGEIVQFIDKSGQLLHPRLKEIYEKRIRSGKAPKDALNDAISVETNAELAAEGKRGQDTRKLDIFPELQVLIYNTSYDVNGDPLGCCTGSLLYDENLAIARPTEVDEALVLNHTVGVTRMMRSVSNQEHQSFVVQPYPLSASIHYPDLNAFFDGADITVGFGLEVDDVIAHEWGHGYVQYTSGLQYLAMSGAMNEAFTDIIGETYDLLDVDTVEETTPRSATADQCTDTPWVFAQVTGSDSGTRWIIGEEVSPPTDPNSHYAFRDMLVPECFGNPGHTSSPLFICDLSYDHGGVHINSGVINRMYALLVDGWDSDGTVVVGIGLTKALNLFWTAQKLLTTTSQFADLGQILQDQCQIMIGADLYEPKLSGDTVIALDTIQPGDCSMVTAAINSVGVMAAYTDVCSQDPTAAPTTSPPTTAPTQRPDGLVCTVEEGVALLSWIGDGYCDWNTLGGDFNSVAFDWDGGDCCPETCVNGPGGTCGSNGYECLDPMTESPTEAPTALPTVALTVAITAPPTMGSSAAMTLPPTRLPSSTGSMPPTYRYNEEPPAVNMDGAALCGLIHSTNMHNVANDWTCTAAEPNTPPCGDLKHPAWRGVKCNADGRVVEVSWQFTDYFVQGHIDASVRHLTEVKYIDFHHQLLKGPIEPELGNLPKLEFLDLSVNLFTGKLPSTFRKLKDRNVEFRVRGNQLENHHNHR